ncbi:hypothetical protein U0070_004182, partial [Myodes glareolus]
MKFNPFVTSDRTKNFKQHFSARNTVFDLCPFERKTKFRLSNYKDQQVDKRGKANGIPVHVGNHPSTVVSTRLKLDRPQKMLEGKPSLDSRKGEGQTQGRNNGEEAVE